MDGSRHYYLTNSLPSLGSLAGAENSAAYGLMRSAQTPLTRLRKRAREALHENTPDMKIKRDRRKKKKKLLNQKEKLKLMLLALVKSFLVIKKRLEQILLVKV